MSDFPQGSGNDSHVWSHHFYSTLYVHRIDILCFIHPFICCWKFALFPFYRSYDHLSKILGGPVFISLEFVATSVIVRSYGNLMFNCLFSKVPTTFYIPTNNVRGSQFLRILTPSSWVWGGISQFWSVFP